MPQRALAVQIGGGHAGLRIGRATVAERGGERGRARLVVQCRAAIVDGRVDRDGPHAGRVAVTVAVVVLAAVAGRPHVYAAEAVAALVDAAHNGLHCGVARSVHRLAVVRGSPRRAVNVDLVRLVAHRVGLDQVGHVRLVQHANARYLRVVRHAHAANVVVTRCRYLAGASRSMTKPQKHSHTHIQIAHINK